MHNEKTFLAIPYQQKDTAKTLVGKLDDGSPGLAWDKVNKCWYAKPSVAIDKIKQWLSDNAKPVQDSIQNAADAFKEALLNLGAIVTGEHI